MKGTMTVNELKKTGERVIEDKYKQSKNDYFIYLCHVATYNFVLPYIAGKSILEFGCGSGYEVIFYRIIASI